MTDAEIQNLIEDRLQSSLVDSQIVPPNSDSFPSKPYLVVELVPLSRINRSLSGGIEETEGFVQVTVVTETNEPVQMSMNIGQQVADLFPYGLKLDRFLVNKPSMVEKGYRDGPDWRTPVRINYEAYSS